MVKNAAPSLISKLSGQLSYRVRVILLFSLVVSLSVLSPLAALASAFVDFSAKECQVSCCGQEKKSCCCEESPPQPNNLEAKVTVPSAPKFVPVNGADKIVSGEAGIFRQIARKEYYSGGLPALPRSLPLYILNRALLI
jgi:hypothetical protein